MAVTKSSAVIAFAAAAVATTTFAIPHQAAAAPSPAPSASVHSDSGQSARNRYPHGLRHEAVTEPSRRPAKTRRLASTAVSAVQVVIDVLDRNGKAPATDDADGVLFYPLDGSDPFYGELDRGHLEGQFPAGQYAVVAYVKTPEGDGYASTSVVYRPRVLVQDATKLVLDAREARPVSVSVDRADARTLDGAVRITQRLGGTPAVTVWGVPLKNSYVTPTAPEKDLDFTVQAVITRNGAQSGSPYVYNVVAAQRQRIPANPDFRVKTADMAEVAVRYGTEGRPVCTGGHAGPAWAEGGGIGFFSGVGAAPATRTEYYSPGVEWDIDWMNTTPDCGFEFDQTEFWSRTVRFSKPGTHRWNLTPAPFGPARPLVIWGSGDEPALAVSMHSTWDGRSSIAPYTGASGSSVLRDSAGRVVYESDQPGTAHGWPVPPPGNYTLTVDEKRDASYSPLAIRQRAVWNSAVRDDGVVQLPSIRYRTRLDTSAAAMAGARQELTLTVDRAPHSRPSLQVSYDDGKTWTPVAVRREGTDWGATFTNPAAGFVSLRATAAGVDQTVIRAYAVRSQRS